jgi:putative FmdB family regulatory protein
MPLYVYACPSCEVVIEELRPAAEAEMPVICPVCKGFCAREVTAAAQPARPREAPAYGRVPAWFHGDGCVCCAPRRRGAT